MTRSTHESLNYAERWLLDGLRVLRPAFSVLQISVDMTQATRRVKELRREGIAATTTPLIIQAVARALAGDPDFHQLIAGTRRYRPARIDIGLSVAGETFVTPVLIIEGADQKTPLEIAADIVRQLPDVRQRDHTMRAALGRWGWLVPFGFLRRALLRLVFMSGEFRRRGAGTFQISMVPGDWALASTFATSGVLMAGQVRSRVVAVDGQPTVRPMMTLTLSGDHGVWDGRSAGRFLAAVKKNLEDE